MAKEKLTDAQIFVREKEVKKTTLRCLCKKTALDPMSLKSVSGYFETDVTFEVEGKAYQFWSVSKILGHANEERVWKIMVHGSHDGKNSWTQAMGYEDFEGVTVTWGTLKRINKVRAAELMKQFAPIIRLTGDNEIDNSFDIDAAIHLG